MKFAKIMRECGVVAEFYPLTSQLDVKLLDREGNELEGKDFHFHEHLLRESSSEYERFCLFLSDHETGLSCGSLMKSIRDVQISETTIAIHLRNGRFYLFFRSWASIPAKKEPLKSGSFLLMFKVLFCIINYSCFSNNINFNLSWVFHFIFNLFSNISCH